MSDSFGSYQTPQKGTFEDETERESSTMVESLLIDPDEEIPIDFILQSTKQRLKSNLECIAEVFSTEKVENIEKILKSVYINVVF